VPICGIAGDQQAALYGQGCLDPGLGKNTYGTGSFVLMNAGDSAPTAPPGLLATVAWAIGERTIYALEAAIFVTGAAVQWLRDGLGIIGAAAETEALAASLDSNDGVYFVPALTGLGSPHWDPYARGTIVGLTRGSTREHLARATLEAIAFQTVDAVQAMERVSERPLQELRADGGATANSWLMQFQADVLGVPIAVAEIAETTALGAALLAGVGVGAWTQSDVASRDGERARFEPRMGGDERYVLIDDWRRAVARARGWARG
jgi:glycerol kinase